MKLLSTFQLATLLAAVSITTTQASNVNFQPAKYRTLHQLGLWLNQDSIELWIKWYS